MRYDFDRAADEWIRIPVDDVGYIHAADLYRMPDKEFLDLVHRAERARYWGWRNAGNKWRENLGLDTTHGKRVMDFGCGIGLEALQFARAGNEVILCDLHPASIAVARRTLKLHGYEDAVYDVRRSFFTEPYVRYIEDIDIFYANGVLHHLPYDRELLHSVKEYLAPDGEVRLMVYTDWGWEHAVGTSAPEGRACDDANYTLFLRFFDEVGEYADFYNARRMKERFGDDYELFHFDYITLTRQYATAVLKPRG